MTTTYQRKTLGGGQPDVLVLYAKRHFCNSSSEKSHDHFLISANVRPLPDRLGQETGIDEPYSRIGSWLGQMTPRITSVLTDATRSAEPSSLLNSPC